MTREIKFRCWDKKQKMMWEVVGINFLKKTVLIIHPVVGNLDLDFKDVILMQDTGLKDKNGKDIYEGDIVKPSKNPCKNPEYHLINYEIFWDEYKWRLRGKYNSQIATGHLKYDNKNWEVIGNIYENPELLK